MIRHQTIIKTFLKVIKDNPILILLTLTLINAIYFIWFLEVYHFLPSPFVFDKYDTFMDFYNPLYWTIKGEFYSTFKSIYPPINYLVLKGFENFIDINSLKNSFELRNKNGYLTLFVISLYLLTIYYVINTGRWKNLYNDKKYLLFILFSLSTPVLFTIERGNLIFFALAALAAYLGTHSKFKRALFFGLLVNFKPYFGLLILRNLSKGHIDKKQLMMELIYAVAIFIGFGLFTELNYFEFIKTYLYFGAKSSISVDGIISFPHSLQSLSLIKYYIRFSSGHSFNFGFSSLKVIGYLMVLFLLYILIFKANLNEEERIIGLIVLICNFSISTGGYILIIYILLIPYLLMSPNYSKMLLCVLGIFFLPLDAIPILSIHHHVMSYLGGEYVNSEFLGLGSVIRPLLNAAILWNCVLILRKSSNQRN